MRTCLRLLVLVAALTPWALAQSPSMKTVEPGSGKPGDEITVAGENLEAKFVAKVYFINGQELEAEIVQQTSQSIKVKIPAKLKPGRYSLMVRTTEKPPKELVQPVRCTVEPPQ